MAEWFKAGANLTRHRKVRKACVAMKSAEPGLLAVRILEINAEGDRDGVLRPHDLEPYSVAEWLMPIRGDLNEDHAQDLVQSLVDSEFIAPTEDGGFRITGWDDFWRPAMTATERTRKFRERQAGRAGTKRSETKRNGVKRSETDETPKERKGKEEIGLLLLEDALRPIGLTGKAGSPEAAAALFAERVSPECVQKVWSKAQQADSPKSWFAGLVLDPPSFRDVATLPAKGPKRTQTHEPPPPPVARRAATARPAEDVDTEACAIRQWMAERHIGGTRKQEGVSGDLARYGFTADDCQAIWDHERVGRSDPAAHASSWLIAVGSARAGGFDCVVEPTHGSGRVQHEAPTLSSDLHRARAEEIADLCQGVYGEKESAHG